MLELVYRPIVQLAYSLKMSQFFTAYTIFIGGLGLSLMYMFVRYVIITRRLSHEVKNPRRTNYTQKLTSNEYEKMKRENTNQQLEALLKSQAYRKYLNDKDNPHSVMNSRVRGIDIQLSDVQWSDDQKQETKKHKK